jgi:DNA primase
MVFQVVRFEPKGFAQRRPNGRDGWVWNLKGIVPVLYRFPEVLKAPKVIICEGEKDVNNLMELGFTATTCPMGVRKWKDEYNDFLKGKYIALPPDNDNEGREHMTQVAISLNGTAKILKWIDLPDLPSKGDVSDWIAKYDDKADAAERLLVMLTEPSKGLCQGQG